MIHPRPHPSTIIISQRSSINAQSVTTVTAVLPAFFRSIPSTDADADPDAAIGENASREMIFLVKRVV
jgi:hypothetical protein